MGYLNKVMLIGRLGQDPEKRMTGNGTSVLNINLATNDYFNDASGQRQERTEWHRIVFWGKLADIVTQYTKKGSQIFVEGTLRTREWEDKTGQKKYTTEIVAGVCQLLDSRDSAQNQSNFSGHSQSQGNPSQPSSSGNPHARSAPQQPHGSEVPAGDSFIEDDIPF